MDFSWLKHQKKKKHGDIIFNIFLKRICFWLRLMAVYIREIQKNGFRKKVPDFLWISFPKPSCPADWHKNWLKKYLFFGTETTTKKASRRRHWRFLELSETIRNRDPKRASVVHVSGKKVGLPSTIAVAAKLSQTNPAGHGEILAHSHVGNFGHKKLLVGGTVVHDVTLCFCSPCLRWTHFLRSHFLPCPRCSYDRAWSILQIYEAQEAEMTSE